MKKIKIKIPDKEYVAVLHKHVRKSGNGGGISAPKEFIGCNVIVLVEKYHPIKDMNIAKKYVKSMT